LLSIVYPESEKIFYPFTTAKGNLSFYYNNFYLFADIEEINFSNEHIKIRGFFNYPPLLKSDEYKIINTNLLITNNHNNDTIIIPLKRTDKSDLLKQYQINT